MNVPTGDLVRSRVVPDAATLLEDALDRRHTGYAVLAPADAVLLDDDGEGVLTFEDGVPVVAYHVGTDRGGAAALGALASPGPYRLELYDLDGDALAGINETAELRVDPGAPAERLAGAPDLADRTRRAAPEGRGESADQTDAVEAFLADEERVEAIRERAREEAQRRAEEWGFTDALENDAP